MQSTETVAISSILQVLPASEGWRAVFGIVAPFDDLDEVAQQVVGEDMEFCAPLVAWAVIDGKLVGLVASDRGKSIEPVTVAQPTLLGDNAQLKTRFVRYLAPGEQPNALDHGFGTGEVTSEEDEE